jgi:DNA topoisomerase-6 subunit B
MKLGEFLAHSHLFGRTTVGNWLKRGYSRVNEGTLKEIIAAGCPKGIMDKSVDSLKDEDFKTLFSAVQKAPLMAPSTRSVFMIGEDTLGKSVNRLGEVDFFSVITRRPTVVDFKPVAVEVAIARLRSSGLEADDQVQVLRFANRVPLQFDKSGCVTTRAIETVNWRSYGIAQPKNSLPQGPFVIAVSVVSPFIKFKNASKETIDSSDDLLEEIRRALMQAGQKLSRHIRAEHRASDLEEKLRHIEQFCPILVEGLCRIVKAPDSRKKKAEEGIAKLLGRDARDAEQHLKDAETALGAEKKAPKDPDDDAGEARAE